MRALRVALSPLLCACLLVLVSACAGAGREPGVPVDTPQPEAGESVGLAAQGQSVLGIYQVELDLEALTATATLEPARDAAMTENYNLDIGGYLGVEDFRIVALASAGGNDFALTYDIHHPIPQPFNICGTIAPNNRADLAVTGRILWLVDDPDAVTYFPGSNNVVANTRAIQNPDGYFKPNGLIDTTPYLANTFPYQLFVDETLNNRVGLTNGGNVEGNYPWEDVQYTQGITGFDYLGQGQTTRHTLLLEGDEMLLTKFRIRVALLAKYSDPRDGFLRPQQVNNRLPCGTNNYTHGPRRMLYYLPHAALDVGTLRNAQVTGTMQAGIASSVQLRVAVRDWDAYAEETFWPNLDREFDTYMVAIGDSGRPFLAVDIPGIPGTTADPLTHDGGGESGAAGSELGYIGLVTGTPASAGVYTGMIRATDIVDVNVPPDWDTRHFALPVGVAQNSEGKTFLPFQVTVN